MLLAGALGFVGRLMAVGYLFEAIHTSFVQRQGKIMMPRLNQATSYPIETITVKTTEVIAHTLSKEVLGEPYQRKFGLDQPISKSARIKFDSDRLGSTQAV